jgi:hypothetical protein
MLTSVMLDLTEDSISNIVVADLIRSVDSNRFNHSTHPDDKIYDKKIQKALKRVIKYYTTIDERRDFGLEY